MKVLYLDKLLHSYVSLEDPTFLVYNYEKIFVELATLVARQSPDLRALFIGGGYTMPRYLEEVHPRSTVEIIEIDPEITRVAFDYLGLRRDTRIVVYHEDARMAVPKLPFAQYQLVVGDAFHDVSVPYHLTTREFNDQLRALLTEDGIHAVNVVDKLQTGRFLRAFVDTLQRTFPHVYVIREDADWADDRQRTQVVAASLRPLSRADVEEANLLAGRGEPIGNFMPEDVFGAWLSSRKSILLTDDYAPVDNLLTSVYVEHTSLIRAVRHYNAGVKLETQSRSLDALAEYDRAIRLDPRLARAYLNRGSLFNRLGEHHRAILDYGEAIRLVPEFTLAYYNRGIALIGLQQYQTALEYLGQAIRLDPKLTPRLPQPGQRPLPAGPVPGRGPGLRPGHPPQPPGRPGPCQPGAGPRRP